MMKKILLTTLLLFSFCEAKNILDPLGREVQIPDNPTKIVAIGPTTLRLLTYMQLDDKLVGIEEFEKKTANAKPYSVAIGKKKIDSLPTFAIGGKPGLLPNFEKLIELKPDIIFVSLYTGLKNIQTIAQRTNIPTIALTYGRGKDFKSISYIEGSKKSFNVLGEIFSKQQRAKELNEAMEKMKNELNSFKTKKQEKSIYIGGLRHKGQRGIIATDYKYMPFGLLGVKNVFSGKKKVGSVFIQKEALLTKNPDVIFLDIGGYEKVHEDMKQNESYYKSLKAFKDKNVYWLFHSNFYSTSLCNLLLNSYIISNKLGMSKIDRHKKAGEIYKLFFKEKSDEVMKKYYLKNINKING